MWPSPSLIVIALSLLSGTISIEIARFGEYSWIEAFDKTSHDVESKALGVGAMPMPMNGGSKGWWARWLAVGGEGDVTVHLSAANITLPHRPAAFPARTSAPFILPLSGQLVAFTSLPPPAHLSQYIDSRDGGRDPTQACNPSTDLRWTPPSPPYKIALVQRGGCDFATKVKAAQERGAAGVIVGDMISHPGETEEEGRERESLITMFSPEDTDNIFIPSVFVSRASYLLLRDMLARGKDSGRDEAGLWIELGQGETEGSALSSLLSFALLMPSLFLCATIAIHRVRVARQRDADRAPPMVVLSLPERIWTPDIVWEKDDSSSDADAEPDTPTAAPKSSSRPPFHSMHSSLLSVPVTATTSTLPAPPSISAGEVADPPSDAPSTSTTSAQKPVKERRKSQKYFSKDECAICMDSFQRGEVVRILPCGHVFHKDECDEWLMKWRKLCPTCRADVTLPPGTPLQGATLTPIAHTDGDDQDEDTPTDIMTFTHLWSSLRGLFSRSRNADPEAQAPVHLEADETTPLVPSTPRRSDRVV